MIAKTLESSILEIKNSILNSDNIQNCHAFCDGLRAFTDLIPRVLLIGCYQDKNDHELYILKSASYILERGKLICLGDDPRYLAIENTSRTLESIATHYAFDLLKSHSRILPHSGCFYELPGLAPDQRTLTIIDNISEAYNALLLGSQNYDNFLNGQAYRFSKPNKNLVPHPKFMDYDDICSALQTHFFVSATHFVFLGQRGSRRTSPSEYRTSQNKTLDEVFDHFREEQFQADLRTAIKLNKPYLDCC